jgi:hypothetical protein
MGQLGPPMVSLSIEGALAAVVVFILFSLLLPRPIFWFRVVGAIALVLSWAPDVALGIGGVPMQTAMRYVGPLTGLIRIGDAGGRPGGGPPPGVQSGGPPPGLLSGQPIEHVIVLMLLHTAVAVVCIGMLTTLARAKTTPPAQSAA